METVKTRYQCRHIFTAGRRCQSPSLRGQDLKAVAEPQIRVPHPFRSLSANRVGYRLRKQTTAIPNTTTNPKPSNPKSVPPNLIFHCSEATTEILVTPQEEFRFGTVDAESDHLCPLSPCAQQVRTKKH